MVFIYAFQTLAFLYNKAMYDALQRIVYSESENYSSYLNGKNFTVGQVYRYAYYAEAMWVQGLIVAYTISLPISQKKSWFWANTVIVFLLIFLLKNQGLPGWNFLKNIFLRPGELFRHSDYYIPLYLLTNGAILLTLGLFTFFNRRINKFIDAQKQAIV